MDTSDAEFVKRALTGDRAAFGPLVERHRPRALRLASHMLGDLVEAEDAAQAACLHAFLSLSRLRDPERFAAWLCGIVVTVCRLRLRLRVRRSEFTVARPGPSRSPVSQTREMTRAGRHLPARTFLSRLLEACALCFHHLLVQFLEQRRWLA